MGLHHYRTDRQTPKLLRFWESRGLCTQSEANQAELMSRADTLIDGLEMLLPTNSSGQAKLQREAIMRVKQVASLVHGSFVLEERSSAGGVIPVKQENEL